MVGVEVTLPDSKARIARFYDRLSPHFRRLWGPHLHDGLFDANTRTREEAQEKLVAFLAEHSGIERGSSVLDIGCGMGATSVWLAEHLSCEATGITLSRVQVEMADRLARERGVQADFRLMDAEATPVSILGVFDAIWMVGVLGHFDRQLDFLRRCHALVRPGGRFVLADWTAGDPISTADRTEIIEPLLDGMLMAELLPRSAYEAVLVRHGWRLVSQHDLTEATRRTWEEGVRIVDAPSLLQLALNLGPDAVGLLTSIRLMKQAMARGLVRYSAVIAERI
ncbi:MAG: SAM-dependent methyltransferase [Myxococcota bacterium]